MSGASSSFWPVRWAASVPSRNEQADRHEACAIGRQDIAPVPRRQGEAPAGGLTLRANMRRKGPAKRMPGRLVSQNQGASFCCHGGEVKKLFTGTPPGK